MEPASRTASPDRSIVNLIKHPSLMRHGNHSSPIAPTDGDGEEKSSLKRTLNKLKVKDRSQRNSEDTERRTSFEVGRKLSKLVPLHHKRRKSPRSHTAAVEGDYERGRSKGADGAGLGITSTDTDTPRDSLDQRPGSITSSLLTDDDDSG